MPIFRPRIAIVGGGPSGLALGLLLHRSGIPSTIYELRSKPTQEELAKPSGMLDLHKESGLTVIRNLGLWDSFQAALGDCSESCRVVNPDAVVLHADEGELASRPEIPRHALTNEGELASRPEIPRHALTNLFLQSLPADFIRWNHKIDAIRSTSNATTGATEITLDLGPHGTSTYDFVIGADGAWSRVRTLLSDVKPLYSGSQFVTATLRHASTNYPHLVELNGSGTLAALGGGKGIMTHRGPQDSIRVYAAVKTPHEDWAKRTGLEGKTAAEVKTTLLGDGELFGTWAAPLKDLLATACDEETRDNPGEDAAIMPLYMLPVGYSWESRMGATLIGDAAHLMTPWAGEGVNLALWDALDLANVLKTMPEVEDVKAWQEALEPRIREFEEGMLERAREKAEESAKNQELMLGENGAQAMADMFKAFYGEMAVVDGQPEVK
jgi:2-polyprenyl-6-methoxyphenol hydroxylase-like FAD-dependent oxidoreductase